MATLEINGKDVEVSDNFLKLSPEEQQRTVEDIASQMTPQEGPKGEVSGAGQTFMEQFAQGAALDAYDTAKSKVTGKSQEQVEADLQASHDASPIAGWGGYIAGTLAGGGLLGGAAKLGLKGAAKLAPGAAKAVTAATKAAPKATAVATGAGAGLGYGTAHRALNDREITGAGAAFDAATGGIGGRIGHAFSKRTKGPAHKEVSKEAFDTVNESEARFLSNSMQGPLQRGIPRHEKGFVEGFDDVYESALKEFHVLDKKALDNAQEMRKLVKQMSKQGDFHAQSLVDLRRLKSRGKEYKDNQVSQRLGEYVKDYSEKVKDPVVAPKGFRSAIEKGMKYTHKDKLADTIMGFAKTNKTFASRKQLLDKPKFKSAYKLLDKDGKAAVDAWINQGFTARAIEMLSNAGLIGTGTALVHMAANPIGGGLQAGALLAAKPINRYMQKNRRNNLEEALRRGPTEIQPIGPTPGLLGAGILGNFGE